MTPARELGACTHRGVCRPSGGKYRRPAGDPSVRREHGLGSRQEGVVITTSNFAGEAVDYVERIEGKKVLLIDEIRVAGLRIEYDVGVTLTKRYELQEISNYFFEEDEGWVRSAEATASNAPAAWPGSCLR